MSREPFPDGSWEGKGEWMIVLGLVVFALLALLATGELAF